MKKIKIARSLSLLLIFALLLSGISAMGAETFSDEIYVVVEESREFGLPMPVVAENVSLMGTTNSLEDVIYRGIKNVDASVNISSFNILRSDIMDYYSSVRGKNPDLFYATGSIKYSYNPITDIVSSITFQYSGNATQIAQQKLLFNAGVDAALAAIPQNASDADKILAAHDYLVYASEYDTASVNLGIPAAQSAYGIFVDNKAVCEGYALAFALLMKKHGIDFAVVTSTAMNHAWNMVKLNGNWYHVDVTWDDPVSDALGRVMHNNFLLSDTAIGQTSTPHHSWQKPETPRTTNATYDNIYWKNIRTRMYYVNNKWYYIEYTSKIIKSSLFDGSSATNVYTVNAAWPLGDGRYWSISPYIGVYNDRIYFNTNSAIQSVNLNGGDLQTWNEPSLSGIQAIYEMKLIGDTVTYRLSTTPNIAPYATKTHSLNNSNIISSLAYRISGNIIAGITTTSADGVKSNLLTGSSNTVKIFNKQASEVTGNALIGTGMTADLYNSSNQLIPGTTKTIAVKGDVDGDCYITALDIVEIKKHLLSIDTPLSGAYLEAAKFLTADSSPNAGVSDIVALAKYIAAA